MDLVIWFFISLLPLATLLWSIQAFIRADVKIRHKFFLLNTKVEKLTDSDARRFSFFYFLGSVIILVALSLYPIWGLDTGIFGGVICFVGFTFYGLAFLTMDRSNSLH